MRDVSPGAEEAAWCEYERAWEDDLDERLYALSRRIQTDTYRPVRSLSCTEPLLAADLIEDCVAQHAVAGLLCKAWGERLVDNEGVKRLQSDRLTRLRIDLARGRVRCIVDIDIDEPLSQRDSPWLLRLLRLRTGDEAAVRLIGRWARSGFSNDSSGGAGSRDLHTERRSQRSCMSWRYANHSTHGLRIGGRISLGGTC
jgi:hypothetical protein